MPKSKVSEDTLKKIFMKKKDVLLKPLSMSIAPQNDPVWSEIANELGNKIKAKSVHWRAYTEGFRELVLIDNEKDASKILEQSASASPSRNNPKKVSRENVLNIFFKRKNEILRPKNTFVVAASNPIWASIAKEMKNVYTPEAIRNMAMNKQEYRNLLLPETHRRRSEEISKNTTISQSLLKKENKVELRNEINAIISEDAILKLVRTTDALIAELRDMKDNQKIGRKILYELRRLRNDIVKPKRRTREARTLKNPKDAGKSRARRSY